jgi:hypothetical protein
LLATLESACADHGVSRTPALPLHGLGDADLTFSAVQALDPYLKRRRQNIYGNGFLPQAVVRFTGDRDQRGALRDGFLTSFVNTSIVQPITAVADHADMVDTWLGVLSRAGFHTRHLSIVGTLAIWHRTPVSGITLRFQHEGLTLGDAVLLWNTDDSSFLATDIGSGLERIRWALTRQPWPENVFGPLAAAGDVGVLDAVRTATLVVGCGIAPASRGPGNAVRRLMRDDAHRAGELGFSRVVRWAHEYWSAVHPMAVPWPEVCRVLELEAFRDR